MDSKNTGNPMPDYFVDLEDPIIDRGKPHSLTDIITITICAVICGADNWVAIERFGHAKESWFKQFLQLENGIPSHDTFGDFFKVLNPKVFGAKFIEWAQSIAQNADRYIIEIDGKTIRRSLDRAGAKAAVHMVSAWSNKNQLVLGQIKTEEKSNEITAVPKLLDMLCVKGAVITADALNCQKAIAQKVVEAAADYALALKGNQGAFYEDVKLYLDDKKESSPSKKVTAKDHGRIEERTHWVCSDLSWLRQKADWAGLTAIGSVESKRTIGSKCSIERRYYILSFDDLDLFSKACRQHWGVENQLHWSLDVSFREDESRTRKGYSAENLSVIRRIALNLLRQEISSKVGIATKRLQAGWDDRYLLKVLGF